MTTAIKAALDKALASKPDSNRPQAATIKPAAIDVERVKFVKEGAQEVFALIQAATEGAESLWQCIVTLHLSGVTWEELERVELCDGKGKAITKDADGNDIIGKGGDVRALRLSDLGAYRTAKSRINTVKKAGVSLLDGSGEMISTNAAKKLSKGTGKGGRKASDSDEGETASNPAANALYTFGDKVSMCKAVFALLATEPTMRKAFRDEIMSTARALANDEAGKVIPRTVRVSAQRAKLAEAAAKAAAAKQAELAETLVSVTLENEKLRKAA